MMNDSTINKGIKETYYWKSESKLASEFSFQYHLSKLLNALKIEVQIYLW